MPIDLLELKNEIINDPINLGYAGKEPIEIARLLNEVRTDITVTIDAEILAWKFLDAIDPDELDALTAEQMEKLKMLLSLGTINLKSANIRAILSRLFPTDSKTAAALRSLIQRNGSRAEQLFGYGTVISHLDVARALRLAKEG